eukprot:TRINITY_DN15932_c0_g2_i3.p2 TRINITY_DN15932_c0_g2~~TRINITY_DN15932_c0_g2_i3.p2  ORF type:complete len:233 (+),score=88.07 TRINITY_DN15932_c0_g2_i3:1-699(+)
MPGKPAPDAALESSLARLDLVLAQAKELKAKMLSACALLRSLGKVFAGISEDATRFYDGWVHAPVELLADLSRSQTGFAEQAPRKTLPVMERDAVKLCDAWILRMQESRARLQGLPELRVTLDHYTKKVHALHKDKERATKNASRWKEEERLMRNLGKLEEARAEYEFARDVVVDEFDKEVRTGRTDFSKILGMISFFQRQWVLELGKATAPNDSVVAGLKELLASPEIHEE